MSLPTIWIVGDWQAPDFADAIEAVRSSFICRCFDSANAARANSPAANELVPAAILLVQSRPGQLLFSSIERLHAQFPLARLIALTGPWCEGELRSGRPVPGIVRVPWRNWQVALKQQLEIACCATAPLPRTATPTDYIESSTSAIRRSQPRDGVAVICTHTLANYGYLADAVRRLGLTAMRHDRAQPIPCPAKAIIFDGWESASAFAMTNERANGNSLPARVLILHFPRPEDHVLARQAGIAAVLGFPLLLPELAAALSTSLKQAA